MNEKSIAQQSPPGKTFPDAGYYQVMVVVEFLPGRVIRTPVSVEFCDEELARHSLEHIQGAHPAAFLVSHRSSVDDPVHQQWLAQYRRRDEAYREQFLPKGGPGHE